MDNVLDLGIRFVSNNPQNFFNSSLVFYLAIATAVLSGLFGIFILLDARRKANSFAFSSGNSIDSNPIQGNKSYSKVLNFDKNKRYLLCASIVLFVISLVFIAIFSFNGRAIADDSGNVVCNDIVAQVNEISGSVECRDGAIVNNSDKDVSVSQVVKNSDTSELFGSGCTINLSSNGVNLYTGLPAAQGETLNFSEEITIPANGGVVPVSASIDGLDRDTANDLVDENNSISLASIVVKEKDTNAVKNYDACEVIEAKDANGLTQVSGLQYTNSQENTQTVNYVPAFTNNNPFYLNDHGVVFYERSNDKNYFYYFTELNNKIKSGITMNELASYYKKSDGSVRNLFVDSSAHDITFYAEVMETWSFAFCEQNAPLEDKVYRRFSDRMMQRLISCSLSPTTVYTQVDENGNNPDNWDDVKDAGSTPTLNGNVPYSIPDDVSSFYFAYGGFDGGILPSEMHVWSSHCFSGNNMAREYSPGAWKAYSPRWVHTGADYTYPALITLTF